MDRVRPGARDPRAPPCTERPQVCSELALPAQLRAALDLCQRERLGNVWHRPTHETEDHSLRPLETHRLDGCRQATFDRGVMRGENHVRALLPDVEFLLECARRPAEIRRRDHIEHELSWRSDPTCDRAERLNRPTDAEIDGDRAGGIQAVETAAGN